VEAVRARSAIARQTERSERIETVVLIGNCGGKGKTAAVLEGTVTY
jgi:tetraacyldisaccharide-1-P 4'-kinase